MKPTYSDLISARKYCQEQVGIYSHQSEFHIVRNKAYFEGIANAWRIRMGEFDTLIEAKLISVTNE